MPTKTKPNTATIIVADRGTKFYSVIKYNGTSYIGGVHFTQAAAVAGCASLALGLGASNIKIENT